MREILFRGKCLDDGEWIFGYYTGPVGIDSSHEICDISDPTGSRIDVDPVTVGQYTGLNDTNGTKIFEGDIVVPVMFRGILDNVYQVEMDDERRGWYPFACGDGCGCCEDETYSPERCEVIGNIHDNPELKEVTRGD